jgi:pimeloyl-ACP methyl ester carboxylesterase
MTPSIVFAHGLWADGSCYSKVIPTLQADGHEVISVQNSLDTVEGDIAYVKRALSLVSSPAILVGHSYGGTVISGAGVDDRVVGLVYICALAPDDGETSQSLIERFPGTPVFNHLQISDGRIWLKPSGTAEFCGDLSPEDQKLVWATQGAPDVNLFNLKVPGGAWRSKPSHFVLGTNDHTVNPDLQRWEVKRMNATVHEVASSHVPMLSHPDVVIAAIRAAAHAAQEATV